MILTLAVVTRQPISELKKLDWAEVNTLSDIVKQQNKRR